MATIKHSLTCVLAFFLALLMPIYLFPLDVIAAENSSINNGNQSEDTVSDAVFELTEMRTSDTKYVLMSDGTIQALVYDTAVHTEDKDGVWQDIDNSLSEKENTIESNRVAFLKCIDDSGELFTLHDADKSITLSLNGAKVTPLSVEVDGTLTGKFATKLEEISTLTKLRSAVRYKDILPNVDVEYVLYGNNVKENIVINDNGENYKYTFELSLKNLEATLEEDGSIVLFDGKEVAYEMPAPFMYDAAGKYSRAISYSLSYDEENGKYSVSLTADSDWINDPKRAFPVTIDPTIKLTGSNATNVSVDSDGEVYSPYLLAGVGDGAIYHSYISFTLPSLPDGSIVTDAELSLYQNNYNSDTENKAYIAARQVTSYWNASTLRWGNKPTNAENVLDFNVVRSVADGLRMSFDITDAYRNWSSGEQNYGIVLSAVQPDSCGGYVVFAGVDNSISVQPTLEVNFRNVRGIEDRYTYQTMSIGAAGDLYLCDNSLEMTLLKPLAYTYSDDVNLVYNSIGRESISSASIANGWSLSVGQTITSQNYLYHPYAVWIDEDGTSHYYHYESSNGFIDEDNEENVIYFVGLNVNEVDLSDFSAYNASYAALEDDEESYLLLKASGEKALFYHGVLSAAVDADGNITEYHYNETVAGANMSLPSASSNVLTSIYTVEKTEDGYEVPSLCVEFRTVGNTIGIIVDNTVYTLMKDSNNDLVSIKKGNTEVAYYVYNNHLLSDIYDVAEGHGLAFTSSGMRQMYEYYDTDSGRTIGKRITLVGGTGDKTTYIDNRAPSTRALIVNYLFDRVGKTVCVYTNDYFDNVYSAANIEYVQALGSAISRNDIYTTTGMLPWNLFANAGIELSGQFSAATFSSEAARTGHRSILLSSSSTAAETTVNLEAGQAYTYSAYVNLENASNISTNGGAYLKVASLSGNEEYTSYQLFTKTDCADAWQRIFVTFTPTATASYRFSLCGSGITGPVYFDDLQLETGAELSAYSYVSNGAMSAANTWSCSESSAVTYTTEDTDTSFTDLTCLKITGNPKKQEYFYQTIPMINTGKSYTLSGWAKASSPVVKDSRTFELRAVITYSDGTSESVSVPFSTDQQGSWQFVSGRVTPDAAKTVNVIKVYARYDYTCGEAYFTGISLVESQAVAVASEETDDETEDQSEYPEESESSLSEMLGCLGMSQAMLNTCLDGELLSSDTITKTLDHEEDSSIWTKTFSNDQFYAAVQQDAENDANRTWYTRTLSIYDVDGNLLCTEDTFGGLTRYSYIDGQMTAETSPLNTVTECTYAGDKLLSAGVLNKANVSYHYSGNTLTGVTAGLNDSNGTQGYTFEYTPYGQLSAVKAGNYTLVSYTYDDDGINVTGVSYANGLVISYVCDMLDRVVEIEYNGNTRYRYAYTGDGELLSVENTATHEKDIGLSGGNTASALKVNTQTGKVIGAFYSSFDEDGQQISGKECFFLGSTWQENATAYTYDDDGRVETAASGNLSLQYSYDILDRIVAVSNSEFTKSYTYRTTNRRTCNLVSALSYAKASGSSLLSLSYEYDAAGNVTTVKDQGILINRYTYDSLGQLTREDSRGANKSYTYTYDSRGNILEKKTYAFTTGTLGAPKSTNTYGYATDSWKDRLTSYNGHAITYDATGNPLSYYNGSSYSFTWEGRQMQSATKGSITWYYTYNSDGLRTSKTNGSTTYTYTWNNGKLTSQHWNGGSFLFYYDAEGNPWYMVFDDGNHECSGTYYFILNLQGDVVALYDPTQDCNVVNYKYDAWGNEVGFSTLNSGYVGLYWNNPIKYRGYQYDNETGFYYVSSRYYDPEIGRFLNSDDPMFLDATGNIASYNLFAYCENNPVNYKDPSGYGPVGTIIGGILGFGLGALLVPRVADLLKLKGWGRKVFIWAGVAALTGLGAYVGNYVGEAIFAVYKAGGAFAAQINKAIAKGISKLVGGTLKSASGNGWVINIKKIVVRVMTSSNYRNNYFKISVAGKAAYDILGNVSSDPAKIHIPITFNSIIKLVQLIFKLK